MNSKTFPPSIQHRKNQKKPTHQLKIRPETKQQRPQNNQHKENRLCRLPQPQSRRPTPGEEEALPMQEEEDHQDPAEEEDPQVEDPQVEALEERSHNRPTKGIANH